jgi:uncharacterized surface protein with fasciclin (FAS1) repeats
MYDYWYVITVLFIHLIMISFSFCCCLCRHTAITLTCVFFLIVIIVIFIDELVCGSDAKDFTTLCELLTTVFPDGVGDDSITVFAATDEAFDNASALLAESDFSDEQMESIVFFHAMEGKLMSTDLVCGQTYNMLSGDDSRFVCTEDGFYQRGGGNKGTIMGSPKIIQADIIACYDSVVHIVDEILLPNWV